MEKSSMTLQQAAEFIGAKFPGCRFDIGVDVTFLPGKDASAEYTITVWPGGGAPLIQRCSPLMAGAAWAVAAESMVDGPAVALERLDAELAGFCR